MLEEHWGYVGKGSGEKLLKETWDYAGNVSWEKMLEENWDYIRKGLGEKCGKQFGITMKKYWRKDV